MIENKKSFEIVSNKSQRIILPNTLTIIGVCVGLSSIKFAMDQNFGLSIIALLISGILDTLDGRIARLIKELQKYKQILVQNINQYRTAKKLWYFLELLYV